MPLVIGGEKAWRVRRSGDIGISYHWVNDEPAMILFPAKRSGPTTGAFVICMSAAWQYANSDGHPNLAYMVPTAAKAAKQMGFTSTDTFAVKAIIDAIIDGIPDLLDMPPDPPTYVDEAVKQNVGDLTIKVDGEEVAQKEIPALTADEAHGAVH